jgi:hypothetical protein
MRNPARALAAALPVLLVLAGLALVSAAAWAVALPAGLAAAGVSCFVLQWYLLEGSKEARR